MASKKAVAVVSQNQDATIIKLEPKDYEPNVISIPITVEGISPLIVNNFGAKGRQHMLATQMQTAKVKRAPKDPVANFEAAKYINAKGENCIPASSFRNAMISAARNVEGIKMTELKQAIFIAQADGNEADTLLPITYKKCVMREDIVRNDNGSADIRHRPEYQDWSCSFQLQIVLNAISVVQAYQLLSMAGFSVGICEWRPASKRGQGGQFGRFKISRAAPTSAA